MTGTIDFKKFTGEKLPNVEEYVRDYYKSHRNIDIMVGTDSQSKGSKTCFSTIIAMYDKEVEESINVAKSLREYGVPIAYVDIDINPNPGSRGQNKSNEVFTAAKGWVEGEGFECRYKTLGYLITSLADWVVKS